MQAGEAKSNNVESLAGTERHLASSSGSFHIWDPKLFQAHTHIILNPAGM